MSETAPSTILKAFCAECGGRRNCGIRAVYNQGGSDGDGHYYWNVDWYILQCMGCEYTFMMQDSSDSEDLHQYIDDAGEEQIDYVIHSKHWPALTTRSKPEWLTITGIEGNVNEALDAVILELYKALEGDLNILAGIGARTCFDIASEVLGVDADLTFQQKIEQLAKDGHVRAGEQGRINILVEAGNGTAHRKWQPSTADIHVVMEILESFLYESLVLPSRKQRSEAKIDKLKQKIPQKKRNLSRT